MLSITVDNANENEGVLEKVSASITCNVKWKIN